jgi:autotransporter translocation and assembly factor TamB
MKKENHHIRQAIKFILISFITVISVSICLLYYLIFTNAGTNILIKNLNNSYKDNIKINKVYGTLSSKIKITEAVIKKDGLILSFQDTELQIDPLSILTGDIALNSFKVKNATLNIAKLIDIPIENINANLLIKSGNISGKLSYQIPGYKLENDISISGQLNNYSIKANIKNPGYTAQITGRGNKVSLELKNNDGNSLKIALNAAWKQSIKMKFSLNGKLDMPEHEHALEFNNLQINTNDTKYSLSLDSLSGMLNGKPLNAVADLKYSLDKITGNANLTYANNKIDFSSEMGQGNDITANIKIANINDLFHEVHGSVNTDINISEPITNPNIAIKYNIENLNTNNVSIESSAGSIKINKESSIDANIKIKNLISEYFNVDNITTTLTGKANKHISLITLSNKEQTITTKITGKYENSDWIGEIKDITYQAKNNLLKLKNNPQISYINNVLKLSKTCVDSQTDNICLAGHINTENNLWQLAAKSAGFDLSKIGGLNIINHATIGDGILTVDVNISGTDNNITNQVGNATLKDALLYLPSQNVYHKINNASLIMRPNDNKINAILHNGDSKLNIDGSCKFKQCKFSITGENFQLTNTQTLKLKTNPNLIVQITNGIAKITGLVKIFQSELLIGTEANALILPNDIHVVKTDPKQEILKLDPNSMVKIILGEDNFIKIGNTMGKLVGEASIFPADNNTLKANGMLNMIGAKYKGYGQDLIIRKGNIKYDNNIIENPEIDIEAVRIIDPELSNTGPKSLEENVAGIKILGPASKPNIELFSSPEQLNNNEILSLILTGKKQSFNEDRIDQDSFDPYTLGSYLLESTGAFNVLSRSLSLEKLSIIDDYGNSDIETNDISSSNKNGLKVLISKKLNNDLLLSGRFGMYSNDYTLSAQYKISDKIMLKGYINELSHGLNILYKLNSY